MSGGTSPFEFQLAYQGAALCLVVYDTLLTFSREVDCIWRREFGMVTIIFVLQRWALALDGLVLAVSTPHLWVRRSRISLLWFILMYHLQECKVQLISDNVIHILGLLGTTAFSTLRIWAIWGQSLTPTMIVFLTSAAVPAINLYGSAQQKEFAVQDGNCLAMLGISPAVSIRTVFRSLTYAARSAAIASDLLVLVLTWVRTADVWRESMKTKSFKPTISMLLLRDGTWYFAALLIMNIVVLLLDAFQTRISAGSNFTDILNALSANLLARFMLDLRSVNKQGSGKPRTMSSINFDIQSLGGNLGAPLGIEDSTWVTGPADDVANGRDQQHEEVAVPFCAGLGLDIEELPVESGRPSTDHELTNNNNNLGDFTGSGPSTSDIQVASRDCEAGLAAEV
ncbi:hypothetical protein EIP91_004118 [Steccherinum ochraceum]|uniref:DUF6533 domain-containing protein n=1 Tax=Steccherinum ochraceum TaxID=92696 RepID=A0A4R0RAG0_9APHY|nr:hypothetical protein EIP91_004118 [Steccherinum ochraceum]